MAAVPERPARPQLVLASSSPRRSQLLEAAGIAFVFGRPGPEPEMPGAPLRVVRERALAKARLAEPPPGCELPVLGVDTVVDLDDVELPKAKDRAEAEAFLRRLAGRRHRVHTAHVLRSSERGFEGMRVASATVECGAVADEELACYLDSGEWRGKAGAYGIQDGAQSFVRLVDGAFDTVVGLHVQAVVELLEEWRRR